MNILNFRIFLSLCLVFSIGFTTIMFFLRKRPILKMINLVFIYIMTVMFLMYIIIIKKSEDILFPVFVIIFLDFLLTFLTGIGIVRNLLKNNGEEEDESN